MDIVTILIAVGVVVFFVVFLAGGTTTKALDTFGAGFLPYRGLGWPRGVQEGEPVAWNWSAMTTRGVPLIDREPAPDTPAEVFELEGDATQPTDLTSVEAGHVSGGTSIRG